MSLSCVVQNEEGKAGLEVGHGAGHEVKLSTGGLGAEADSGGHGVNLFTGHGAEPQGKKLVDTESTRLLFDTAVSTAHDDGRMVSG